MVVLILMSLLVLSSVILVPHRAAAINNNNWYRLYITFSRYKRHFALEVLCFRVCTTSVRDLVFCLVGCVDIDKKIRINRRSTTMLCKLVASGWAQVEAYASFKCIVGLLICLPMLRNCYRFSDSYTVLSISISISTTKGCSIWQTAAFQSQTSPVVSDYVLHVVAN